MKRVVVLGSTGSIGESALNVAEALPEVIKITGLAARSNVARLIDQALQFDVGVIAVADLAAALQAEALARPHGIEVWAGDEGVAALAAQAGADIVCCAWVGLAGLRPILAAMAAGHDVALATKEVLVAAGELVMRRRAEAQINMLPIDSEHSALFQCLQSAFYVPACVRQTQSAKSGTAMGAYCAPKNAEDYIEGLILTASGGPFSARPEVDFNKVTPQEALAHPRWQMGRKVTIDSATMMNKGFEVLEAGWLFNIPIEKISVTVHPESIVHSLVTFVDGSTLAQLSDPDMRIPIQVALTWPERFKTRVPMLDLARQKQLSFSEPDLKRFPCLRLVREAAQAGGTLPAVLNAADEVAVEAFLQGRITFAGIWQILERVMLAHEVGVCSDFEAVFEADAWARKCAGKLCGMEI